MGSKRIEQSIDEIYEFIEGCKPKGFSSTAVIVQKEQLYDLLDEMKLRIPDEISRCNKVLNNRDEIIKEAEIKAQKIIEEAQLKAEAMVHDSEIMRQAYLQANEFISRANASAEETVNNATYEANQIRNGAFDYTKEMLLHIENVLSEAYNTAKTKSDELLEVLYKNLDQVVANRKELCEEVAPEQPEDNQENYEDRLFGEDEENEEHDEEFNPDGDAFLKNIE